MQYSLILASMLAVASGAAISSFNPENISATEVIEGYTMTDMDWTPEGAEEVSYTGSIESVVEQIKAVDSDFELSNVDEVDPDVSDIAARHTLPPVCYKSGEFAQNNRISEGIKYLRGLPGKCGVRARSCTRISCSHNSAIYLCNDNNHSIKPSCKYLGNSAKKIMDSCSKFGSQNRQNCQGQQFDTDNYNVIVKRGNC